MYKITKKELVDSISIPIMYLGNNIILSHKVKLSRPDKLGKRDYYHKEFTYPSKYSDPKRVTTLRLNHSSILTIENKNEKSIRESIIINISNRDFIVKSLSSIKKILKNPDLFIEHDEKFIVNPKLKKESIISVSPYKDKIIIVKPCVIETDDNDYVIGVELCLDYTNMTFIQIKLETFKSFLNIIKKFDFHVAGIAAITYLQSSEIGNHEVDIYQSSINDFDADLEPVHSVKPKDTKLDEFVVKKKEFINNKGW